MNLPILNRRQQLLLGVSAVAIAAVQIYQLVQREFEGIGWVFPFTIAALLLTWSLQGSSTPTSVEQSDGFVSRRRRSVYLVAAILVGAVLVAFSLVAVRRSQTAVIAEPENLERALGEQELENKPVPVLSLDALLTEYQENEIEASAKYGCARNIMLVTGGCRVIETSAEIEDIGRDPRQVPYLRLATSTPIVTGLTPAIMRSIEARFSDRDGIFPADETALRGLRRGQRVTLRCTPLYNANRLTLAGCAVAQ